MDVSSVDVHVYHTFTSISCGTTNGPSPESILKRKSVRTNGRWRRARLIILNGILSYFQIIFHSMSCSVFHQDDQARNGTRNYWSAASRQCARIFRFRKHHRFSWRAQRIFKKERKKNEIKREIILFPFRMDGRSKWKTHQRCDLQQSNFISLFFSTINHFVPSLFLLVVHSITLFPALLFI